MTRNTESHFANLPSIDIERSVMDLSHGHITTANAGDIIPVMCKEVLAGDTFEVNTSVVCRAQTMLTPIFSNINLDYYYYFVPFRLIWEHFPEFFGENRSSAWIQPVEYSIPSISSPSGGFVTNSLADYFGYPVGITWSATDKLAPSALPFRAYSLCCDQWHRDQNVSDPFNIPLGDSNQTGTNGSNYINDCANGGMPFKAAKYHDYFTSCLPSAQKGTPVAFGVAPSISGKIPVGTLADNTVPGEGFDTSALRWKPVSTFAPADGSKYSIGAHWFAGDGFGTTRATTNSGTEASDSGLYPANLWASFDDATNYTISGVSFTINELRLAFQLQKFYEKQARGGSRLIEVLKQHFGVTSPDARLQRTEYLGGKRVPLYVHEITNSAQTSTDFLGDVGAKLATSDVDGSFVKSFTEPGYVLCLAVIRYPHYYVQGIDKQFLRKKFDQFFWPVFSSIGEQPVYDAELYADSTTIANDTVFGYQEAYADYRFSRDYVSGQMRPGISGSLASWHLADYYTQKPTLSDSWIREDKTNVDRVLAVGSSVSNQFFLDFWFDIKATRPMPVYSIPGLIDHH